MSFPAILSPSSLRSALRRIADRVRAARARSHQRLELQGMSDRELMDLGLGRSEVQAYLRRSTPSARHGSEALAGARSAAQEAPRSRTAPARAAGRRPGSAGSMPA